MILVTGGCGYIGSHIVKKLSELGEQVAVLDNLSAGRSTALLHHEELIVGDITDELVVRQFFASHPINVIIHCAALVNAAESVSKNDEYIKVNAQGSRLIWQEAKRAGVKHYLYLSSAAVYGDPGREPITEKTLPHPSNPYGETKLSGENYLKDVVGSHSTNYLIFRLFNVAGAERNGRLSQSHSSRAIIPRLLTVAHGDKPKLVLNGTDYDTVDGSVVRDFIHVEDIAQAITLGLKYLKKGGSSQTLNLGTGQPTSMFALHALAERVTGHPIPLTLEPRINGDIIYSLSDSSLAKKVLGWQPAKSVEVMIKDAWNAYDHH